MFVNHTFAKGNLPPFAGGLYEYVVGSNGIFVRASRPGLRALIWVASTDVPVRGLAEVTPSVELDPLVPAPQVARLFEKAYRAQGNEVLFYLNYWDGWRIDMPAQIQAGASVRPTDPYAGGVNTMIEVHSHHSMKCFFSGTDNREERAGFRIYAVIGNLARRPSILVRVGIYGHFWEIPAAWVFELPAGISDALSYETNIEEPETYELED